MLSHMMLMVFLIALTGCGLSSGLTRSEGLANSHPLLLTAKRDKGNILIQEGLEFLREGSFDKFLNSTDEALRFYDGVLEKQSDIIRYRGKAFLDRNEYERALFSFRESLELARRSTYFDGLVLATRGLADCYIKIGDVDGAMDVFNDIYNHKVFSALDKDIRIILGKAELLVLQGHLSEAFTMLNSASVFDIDADSAQSLLLLRGAIQSRMGDNQQALNSYQQALVLARKKLNTPELVDILNNVGFVQLALKRYDEAARSFNEGLGLLKVMNLVYPEKQLNANYGLGQIFQERNNRETALRYFAQAIAYTEQLRDSLQSTELRSLFLSSRVSAYEHAIDLLVPYDELAGVKVPLPSSLAGFTGLAGSDLAFFYAESTKSRAFLELLAKGNSEKITDRIPKELAYKERRLYSIINSIQGAKSVQTEEQQLTLQRSQQELDRLIDLFRRQYPDYAAIRYPEPVASNQVPLRDNELVLTFKVNDNATYLWLLEKGKKTEVAIIKQNRAVISRLVSEFRRRIEDPSRIYSFDTAGSALANLLLGQVMPRLDRRKHIIIIPDGALNLVPFEALQTEQGAFLGDQFKISYYPSASVMAVMRRSHISESHERPFFGVGDPVYDEGDPRYSGSKAEPLPALASAAGNNAPVLRSVLARNGVALNRLPETRDELLTIGSIFGYHSNNPALKLDMHASKNEVLQSPLASFRYVHFATHGLLSGDIPYILEPALVLSQPGNKRPEDGFLKMSEVLDMRLTSDAVVLSACKTALGKEVAGEGVVGFSRAFMLAGAKSVIVSLWSVESSSTAELMKNVYAFLKNGKSKEESLRLAKELLKNDGQSMSSQQRGLSVVGKKTSVALPGKSHPFYWAPFILIGEWE